MFFATLAALIHSLTVFCARPICRAYSTAATSSGAPVRWTAAARFTEGTETFIISAASDWDFKRSFDPLKSSLRRSPPFPRFAIRAPTIPRCDSFRCRRFRFSDTTNDVIASPSPWYTQEEIAEAVGCDTTDKALRVSGNLAVLPNYQKSSAVHAIDFDPPLYNIWRQQENAPAAVVGALVVVGLFIRRRH